MTKVIEKVHGLKIDPPFLNKVDIQQKFPARTATHKTVRVSENKISNKEDFAQRYGKFRQMPKQDKKFESERQIHP